MLFAIQAFINVQRVFIASFRNRVLFNATIDIAKVEITVRYRGMLLAVNNFFNGKRLLIASCKKFPGCCNLPLRYHGVHHKSLF